MHSLTHTHTHAHTHISAPHPRLSLSAAWTGFRHNAITAHYLLISLLLYAWFWPVFWMALVSSNVLWHKLCYIVFWEAEKEVTCCLLFAVKVYNRQFFHCFPVKVYNERQVIILYGFCLKWFYCKKIDG